MIARQLYDPRNEHDACGVGFIANIRGQKSHDIIKSGLQILLNLDHRSAVGADPLMGDGAGCLIQMPDALLRHWADERGIELPPEGRYAVAMCFLPRDERVRSFAMAHFEHFIRAEGQRLVAWRDVGVSLDGLGRRVIETMPYIAQAIVAAAPGVRDQDAFERKILTIRKQTLNSLFKLAQEKGLPGLPEFYMPSFSTRTVVYKGLLLAGQVESFYDDLRNPLTVSALAMVHQRFSTNTFPSWRLAQPYRLICHNGEINTVRGNTNWMAARRQATSSDLLGSDLAKMVPLIGAGQSDTACLDNALELLVLGGGYSLAHAMMMLIPEAWADPLMDPDRRAFYEYHAALMEPWDGPAAIAFSDGRQIGATLDRNGLRPARYILTDDDRLILASEAGVLPVPEEKIVKKWRLQPGKMLLIDLEEGRIISDDEIKQKLAAEHPYDAWLKQTQYKLEELPEAPEAVVPHVSNDPSTRLDLQQAFGYTQEDMQFFLEPMAREGDDPVGSMGTDTPIAAFSNRPRLLYNYFKQNFAQVTNPPIDPIREQLVMSLISMIGPRPNLLSHEVGTHHRLEVAQPILTDEELAKIRNIEGLVDGKFKTDTLDITWPVADGAAGIKAALDRLCAEATAAVQAGHNILILSDRGVSLERVPIPALLATSAVHHHLIREGLRTSTGIVVETGDAREVHHFCVLAGYGAEAINPYLAFATLEQIRTENGLPLKVYEVQKNFIKAIGKGILKVMSKMGISTYQSYCGAQIFDAVGLQDAFVDQYFTGTATTIEGADLKAIAEEALVRHARAYGDNPIYRQMLDVGGDYAFRLRGEAHAWTPQSIAKLQHAVRDNSATDYKAFAATINDQSERLLTIRGLMQFRMAEKPVPIEEVEPAASIVKRFATGAMSFGSISREAHTTLAIAMNRIGGKSNTGEGGEEAERFMPMPNGDSKRSAIKQVASGRFGVTAEYLVNADVLQIKMAQGASPGEGGYLPSRKVSGEVARLRRSTPGVELFSPPAQQDVFSIEDLAQLVYDLKNANPAADVSVKLVSEVGVGTAAAGVSKARADHVTIAGFEGGTGASPLTSLTHAGSPWEIGLAETQQTLVRNGLRGRIAVQVDGGLRTGRDVVVGALLGADEFGFATAPLIAAGCIMMRKCHLNTCPVGVATQDPVLRARFTGQPEHVINYFFFVAEEVREWMAQLGLRRFDDMVGRVDKLDMIRAINHWKAKGVDLSRVLYQEHAAPGVAICHCERQDHGLDMALDNELIAESRNAIDSRQPVRIEKPIRNVNRTVGAMLSGEIAKKYGHGGLPEDTIWAKFYGQAGQSFGAFLAHGVTLELHGDANDYVGKGLSGGRLIVRQPNSASREPTENIIIGNTVLYGATAGEAYFEGVAGERFAVRNSGAIAVVEGTGDHGCEYMTGGVVAVLGDTGRNFAAGMSGGVAYVYDPSGGFTNVCNAADVELESIAPVDGDDDEEGRPTQQPPSADDNGMGDLQRFDAQRLRILVERHLLMTGSARARYLLENWTHVLANFVKVMPRAYRQSLLERRGEQDVLTTPIERLGSHEEPTGNRYQVTNAPRYVSPILDTADRTLLMSEKPVAPHETFRPIATTRHFSAEQLSILESLLNSDDLSQLGHIGDSISSSIPHDLLTAILEATDTFRATLSNISRTQVLFVTSKSRSIREHHSRQILEDLEKVKSQLSGEDNVARRQLLSAAERWREIANHQYRDLSKGVPQPFFRAGAPVDPESVAFVSRQDIFDDITNEIFDGTGCPGIVLYGRRRTGKTTILKNLEKLLRDGLISIVHDMKDPHLSTSTESFSGTIISSISEKLGSSKFGSLGVPNLVTLTETLRRANAIAKETKKHIVVAIDEYEEIDTGIREGALAKEILSTIRHIIETNERITWIFAGSHSLEELSYPGWNSNLISATTINVPLFSPSQTRELLTDPLRYSPRYANDVDGRPRVPESLWSEGGIQIIHDEAGGWPHLVQLIAETLTNMLRYQGLAQADRSFLESAICRAVERGNGVLRELITEEASKEERSYLQNFKYRDLQAPPESPSVRASLRRRLLIIEDESGWKLRVPLMRRWLRTAGDLL